MELLLAARFGGLIFFFCCLLAGIVAPASAQDAARGRTLYVENCARCHADPPGSGFVDPRVRTADEILATIQRVSPMRFLSTLIAAQEARELATYFNDSPGPATNRPDYNVGDFWWDQKSGGMSVNLRQFAGRDQLAGIWYTYDAQGQPVWYLFNGGSWSAPSIYTAPLYASEGSPFMQPFSAQRFQQRQVGTVALVFSDRDNVDFTFIVNGQRALAKMVRFPFPR